MVPNKDHLLLNLFLILSFPFLSPVFSDLDSDRAALIRLRDSIRGRTLTWNTRNSTANDSSPCFWEGVRCDLTINRVIELRLPGDRLSGQIPVNTLGNLTRLRVLSLRHNSLSGPIPSDLGLCTELIHINLENNRFSGEIPDGLFRLINLERLNLAGNEISGPISSGFNSLMRLRILYLQNNQFNGSIPELNNLSVLQQFNVSFNRLNGSIPKRLNRFPSNSFSNNSLCGEPLPSCPDRKRDNHLSPGAIAGIVLGSIIVVIFLVLIIVFSIGKMKTVKNPNPSEEPDFKIPRSQIMVREVSSKNKKNNNGGGGGSGLVFFGDKRDEKSFNLEELLRASAEVLGKGILGTTYKAYLESGENVVVKRLRNVCVSEEEFRKKVEILGFLNHHENLVPLKAYFFGKDERLIVYQSFPANLHSTLHGPNRPLLTWKIRCKIALGIAHGLDYLHNSLQNLGSSNYFLISHGSIKSSNIMLDSNYNSSLSEYCISNLISSPSPSSSSGRGYGAPEVIEVEGRGRVSQKADVYSYGVLLLELLTGKDPQRTTTTSTEGEEERNCVNLPKWVRSVVQERWTIQVFDTELIRDNQNYEEQMVQILHLAIACTSRSPEKRPSMKDVVVRIHGICGVESV